jgi:hypothetical protein
MPDPIKYRPIDRPISLTAASCRVMERTANYNLLNYSLANKLSDNQWARNHGIQSVVYSAQKCAETHLHAFSTEHFPWVIPRISVKMAMGKELGGEEICKIREKVMGEKRVEARK